MFDAFGSSLRAALARLSSATELTASNVADGLRDVRRALLEADVPLEVVGPFLERVQRGALGAPLLPGVTPAQQLVGAVHAELVALLGPVEARIAPAEHEGAPTVVLVAGLQGSGKTTSCAKLAALLCKRGRRPLLAASDLRRPAAVEQLARLGERAGVPVVGPADVARGALRGLLGGATHPAEVARRAVERAVELGRDVVIVDTAGRLHVDAALMAELREVREAVRPRHVLYACDAMSGQDALRVARAFADAAPLDGVLLTKTDGDARGGAALGIKAVVGVPIWYLGTGEGLDDLEELRPAALADRILDRGDVVRLVQLAREHADEAEAERSARRLQEGRLGFDDLLAQLRAMRKIGLRRLLGLIPGAAALRDRVDDDALAPLEAVVCSMTPAERRRPELLSDRGGGARRRRIARGSGVPVQAVSRLVKELKRVQRLLGPLARAR